MDIRSDPILPGATATEFHTRAGTAKTVIGAREKRSPTIVAELGFWALMADLYHVAGGSDSTPQAVRDNRTTPEPVKAARYAVLTRPR